MKLISYWPRIQEWFQSATLPRQILKGHHGLRLFHQMEHHPTLPYFSSLAPPMVAAERVILRARPKSANLVCICPCDRGFFRKWAVYLIKISLKNTGITILWCNKYLYRHTYTISLHYITVHYVHNIHYIHYIQNIHYIHTYINQRHRFAA